MLRRVFVLSTICLLALTQIPVAKAESPVPQEFQRAGFNSLVSIATDGTQGDATSADTDITPDGRYATYFSDSTSLVPNDTNEWGDVFLTDRVAGTTERISTAADGTEANQMSMQGAISADGRYVAFLSYATNISNESGLQIRVAEVYVRDRVANTVTRITKGPNGEASSSGALGPEISADGRYITFFSASNNLVPGDTNDKNDIFVFDQQTQEMSRITDGDGSSSFPAISRDGRYVSFYSKATNLVAGDNNGVGDTFLHDRQTGITELVSKSSTGELGNGSSFALSEISQDGRYVAFQSDAFNLVPSDTSHTLHINGGGSDIFVRDRELGTTERVSLKSSGGEFIKCSGLSMTPDARYVAFSCIKDTSDPADFVAPADIWLHDLETGATELVSARPSGTPADGESENPRLTDDARYVFFQTSGGEFVPSDANELMDVVVRDRVTNFGTFGLKVKGFGNNRALVGDAVYPGVALASATDPVDATGGTQFGAEITGASLIYRRDRADLLLRIPVTDIPYVAEATPAAYVQHGGAPAMIHGVRFTIGSTDFEIRAMRVAATEVPPAAPSFTRHICTTTCGGGLPLEGGYGTAGQEIRIAITTATLALQPGETLENVQVFSGFGESAPGVIGDLDTLSLPNITLPDTSIRLGLGDVGADDSAVSYDVDSGSAGGMVNFLLQNLPWEGRAVWTKACIGETCAPATRLI